MLHLSSDRARPTVIGHVQNQICPILHKIRIQIAKHILKTDRSGEPDTLLGLKHYTLSSLFPPIVVIGQKDVVEPRHLLLIWKMLGERNKMLLPVSLLDLTILKEYDSIVILTIPTSIFIIWLIAIKHSFWISSKKWDRQALAEVDEFINQPGSIIVIIGIRILGMPSDGRNKGGLRPDNHIRIFQKHLVCHLPQIVEVPLICRVSTFL